MQEEKRLTVNATSITLVFGCIKKMIYIVFCKKKEMERERKKRGNLFFLEKKKEN